VNLTIPKYGLSRKSDSILRIWSGDHPETFRAPHRYGGGAGRRDSSFRVHIRQNLSDSRNDTQLLRNMGEESGTFRAIIVGAGWHSHKHVSPELTSA
jgi:hypothetical protein